MALPLEAQLDRYPDLPLEARAELRGQIEAGRPDLQTDLEACEALTGLLEGFRQEEGAVRLAELAAAHATGTASAFEKSLWARLDARAATDPALRARLDAMQARLASLSVTLTDPRARFEQLIASGARPASPRAQAHVRADRPAVARTRARMPRWGRVLVAASVGIVVVFGALRLALRPSPFAFTDEEVGTEEFGPLRGDAAPTDPTEALYLRTLDELAQTQRSFLGLPFQPDPERLDRSAQGLAQVVENSPPGSFVRLEAAYRLGKLRLLQGDGAAAQPLLTEVVTEEGRYAAEAAALLELSATRRE